MRFSEILVLTAASMGAVALAAPQNGAANGANANVPAVPAPGTVQPAANGALDKDPFKDKDGKDDDRDGRRGRSRSRSRDGRKDRSPSRDDRDRSRSRDGRKDRSPSRDGRKDRSPSRDGRKDRSPSRDGRKKWWA